MTSTWAQKMLLELSPPPMGSCPRWMPRTDTLNRDFARLTNLLVDGLGKIPPATARVELSSADASVVAAYVGSALDSMQLPETNGDPIMKLPLDGSPSARSMTVCDHRSTSRPLGALKLGVDRREGQPHRQGRIADRLDEGHGFRCQLRRLAHPVLIRVIHHQPRHADGQ